LAIKRYEQVLNLDPYNAAARNGMEQVNEQRNSYYKETYNETRSRMLWLVDREWEKPVRKLGKGDRSTETTSLATGSTASKDAILRKLNTIVLDRVDLDDVTIREAVEILKQKSRELDTSTDDPKKRGVNIVLKIPAQPALPAATEGEAASAPSTTVSENSKITLNLRNVPMMEAIRYLTEISGLKHKVEPFAVSIVPVTESTEELLVKEYRVSPGFIPTATAAGSETIPAPSTPSEEGSNQRLRGVKNATEYLKEQGVPFPSGAFAQYIPSGSKLIVRNTQGALDLVDTLVEGDVGVAPTQVEIESKFVEISQNNVNELGFDWLLGPFSIGGGVYGDGGTRPGDGTLSNDYYNNFPFGSVAGNPMTAGNRSGIGTSVNSAITANSIDALIAGVPQGANVASPGILGIAGIFTNPQFQMVIRALSQQKGVDLMSAPKVTTKSGNSATIKITREFPFPSEFDPPQVPESNSSSNNSNGGSAAAIVTTSGMVTPATPTSFEKRDLGVILEVEPQVGADNYTIDLSLAPEVVEFDGFVNYGSPIIGPRYDPALIAAGNPSGIGTFEITPNTMNQPIFSVRKVTTQVSIWDGQTVALGGLIREDVQKVNDKVPILGDIPLAGRLFRSNVDQKIKKNLIVFVTARLLDAAGQPLIQQDEAEEIVEPLGPPEDLPAPRLESRSRGK
jgi:general secretion pathway protein D